MELRDLFVSFEQVDPVQFDRPKPELPKPIYLNFDRAQKVTSGNTETADVTTEEGDMNWVVGGSETAKLESDISEDQVFDSEINYNWQAGSKPSSVQTSSQTTPEQSKPIVNTSNVPVTNSPIVNTPVTNTSVTNTSVTTPIVNNSIVNTTPIQKTSIQTNTSIPTQPTPVQTKSQQPVIESNIKSTSIAKSNVQSGRVNRWTSPYKDQRKLWITDMTNAYKKLGLNDNAIKNLIAKNAFESGWGKSAQGAFNFGNITTGKYWKGNYVQGRDTDADGNPIGQKFRAYDTIDDYVKDEVDFLTRLYDFNQDDNFDIFINKLQGNNSGKRRYAEARDYVTKVKGVYNSI